MAGGFAIARVRRAAYRPRMISRMDLAPPPLSPTALGGTGRRIEEGAPTSLGIDGLSALTPRTGVVGRTCAIGGCEDLHSPGRSLTGTPLWAAAMKSCQATAGSEPPVTPFIGCPSSLPNHTPVTRLAV